MGNLAYNLIKVDLFISLLSKCFISVFSEVFHVSLAFMLMFCRPESVLSRGSYFFWVHKARVSR